MGERIISGSSRSIPQIASTNPASLLNALNGLPPRTRRPPSAVGFLQGIKKFAPKPMLGAGCQQEMTLLMVCTPPRAPHHPGQLHEARHPHHHHHHWLACFVRAVSLGIPAAAA